MVAHNGLGSSRLRNALEKHSHQLDSSANTDSTFTDGKHDATKPNDLHIDLPRLPMAAEIAFAGLATLPTPILILSSLKTILLANNAAGKLLGVEQNGSEQSFTDLLRGQNLSQIGIDMMSDGAPVWVSWEKFLDNLARGMQLSPEDTNSPETLLPRVPSGETTPTATPALQKERPLVKNKSNKTKDTVVDVVISAQNSALRNHRSARSNRSRNPSVQATCRMIISIWSLEGQRYFTLSFTSVPVHSARKYHDREQPRPPVQRTSSSHSTKSSRSSQSITPGSSTANSQVVSPSENTNGNAFHPNGLPPQCNAPSTFTDFQKLTKMKNAMLNATEIPLLSMWKDESVVFPNLAARRLLQVDADPTSDDSYDFKSRFNPWSADFSRQLGEGDNPIIALCRTQKPFTRWQIGMKNEKTGKKLNFDVSGHPVFDEKTNEFLAGMIAFKDVTEYTEQIASKSAENEEQFRLICNTMPQMCWTTSPDGYHDYFSQRWYDYTGLTPANSLGLGWKLPFHDEDMPEAGARWAHSLATGDEYKTQYRCRRYDGEWRWMLGRALPLRDHNTGQILRWFGTCTDIQEIIDAKESGQRARKSLMDVLQHSQMTLWMVDRDTNVTFFEGSFPNEAQISKTVIGTPVTEVLSRFLNNESIRGISRAVARTLQGESDMEIIEHKVDGRWIRTKLVPLKGKQGPNGVVDEAYIAGVIGIGTEVTQLRQKEQENIKLLANETAAKEASKMKSNFLANMSHEIRTPIAGVLGMSELLMDTILDPEQTEFAQNIQRSANSLLTVINDILDFSKIESGRLDIEEVQFSLGVVLEDVAKMLSFAAQRKGLDFSNDVHFGLTEDIILLGDPGRIRQILTNLLTNSIKFTSDGYVKLSTKIIEDTNDTATVEFMVEDTGIGIEEEVKKRLFRPFSQADSSTARRFGGTGLGLTICKNLVDLMHGSIRLDSKLDSGTKAIFAIPFKKPEFRSGGNTTFLEVGSMPDRLQSELSLSQSRSSKDDHRKSHRISPPLNSASLFHSKFGAFAPTSVDAAAEVEIQRDQYHVLVVEDNPVNQQIALKFIKGLGFSVSAVWNGKEALEYLLKATSTDLTPEQSQSYPMPSLVLMDVQMPVLDGYHTTHMLRHHAPFNSIAAIRKIPIVAMTASAIQGDREKCEKAGMDDYMAKPVKRVTLESTILKWITSGRNSRTPSPVEDPRKPSLARTETDHSSNCTQYDAILAEFLGQKSPAASPGATKLDLDVSSAVEKSLARQPNLVQSLARGGYNGDTEGDRSMRRVEAEDQARSLRDAKLLHATEDESAHTPTSPRVKFENIQSSSEGSSKSSQLRPQTPRMALTEENVTRFNNVQERDVDPDTPSSTGVASEGLQYAMSDLPGPPPEGLIAAEDLAGVDANAEALVQVLLETAKHPHEPPDEMKASMSGSPTRSRKAVGGLSWDKRQPSDWSASTAKPER